MAAIFEGTRPETRVSEVLIKTRTSAAIGSKTARLSEIAPPATAFMIALIGNVRAKAKSTPIRPEQIPISIVSALKTLEISKKIKLCDLRLENIVTKLFDSVLRAFETLF